MVDIVSDGVQHISRNITDYSPIGMLFGRDLITAVPVKFRLGGQRELVLQAVLLSMVDKRAYGDLVDIGRQDGRPVVAIFRAAAEGEHDSQGIGAIHSHPS